MLFEQDAALKIEIKKLSKVFRTHDVETTAINAIDLVIESGEFVSLMGPSGCGKSTLLHILGLIDAPTEGQIFMGDRDVSKCNSSASAALRKENIGFVFQDFNLIDDLSVYENVELPLIYNRVKASERKGRVQQVLEKVNVAHRTGHYPLQLSGGQQQRVAVARAIVNQPKLILADEPTGNLDSANGNEVMQLLCQLNEEGSTVVMVTHSEHDSAYATRTVRLHDGEIKDGGGGASRA